jgi:hypothetical protein
METPYFRAKKSPRESFENNTESIEINRFYENFNENTLKL